MNTILILTDFSDEATNAARFTVALAEQLNARRIILYHSAELAITTAAAGVSSYVPVTENVSGKDRLMALKNELLSSYPNPVQIDVYHDDKPFAEAIDAMIAKEQVDLVVIGATTKGDLEESFFGGNTMTVINQCTKPVLVVPRDSKFRLIKNVLFACDLNKVLQTIPAQFIKSFTEALNAKLFIVNADYKEKHFHAETILEQTDLHKVFDDINAEYDYIDSKDIVEGILAFAGDHDIQLLISVKKEHGLLREVFHPSVSKKLIFDSGIPLLVLKEND